MQVFGIFRGYCGNSALFQGMRHRNDHPTTWPGWDIFYINNNYKIFIGIKPKKLNIPTFGGSQASSLSSSAVQHAGVMLVVVLS